VQIPPTRLKPSPKPSSWADEGVLAMHRPFLGLSRFWPGQKGEKLVRHAREHYRVRPRVCIRRAAQPRPPDFEKFRMDRKGRRTERGEVDIKKIQSWTCPTSRSVQPSGRIYQSKAKSQRIAAWELLYRVQHPGRYVSRLQTILHSDIAVKVPRHEDDRHNAKHHCDGSFFRPSSESGSAAVNEDHVHGPNINRLP
jgi:hypothetical protein